MNKCDCGLPTDPPMSGEWWQPTVDDDPDPHVKAVVQVGEDPKFRRAVRREDGSGWSEYGAVAKGYADITPPMPWSRVGTCWADVSHPVIACDPDAPLTFGSRSETRKGDN
jgi:hypothetical protein